MCVTLKILFLFVLQLHKFVFPVVHGCILSCLFINAQLDSAVTFHSVVEFLNICAAHSHHYAVELYQWKGVRVEHYLQEELFQSRSPLLRPR